MSQQYARSAGTLDPNILGSVFDGPTAEFLQSGLYPTNSGGFACASYKSVDLSIARAHSALVINDEYHTTISPDSPPKIGYGRDPEIMNTLLSQIVQYRKMVFDIISYLGITNVSEVGAHIGMVGASGYLIRVGVPAQVAKCSYRLPITSRLAPDFLPVNRRDRLFEKDNIAIISEILKFFNGQVGPNTDPTPYLNQHSSRYWGEIGAIWNYIVDNPMFARAYQNGSLNSITSRVW